ncbi:ribosome maturation factor RimP [Inhella gelatinilytica]|uniref:Ribosome maturation factor RimP n=1 Tax=Inhella gelatinilytica TaxID=2795030 RepID=A0A931J001_9BURK|nr:ribosome maturation factor RimP [Inhella gelatinilytica]MBH9554249.1 ribosome maturation factor RimP [Inhella gelatinilytica]
MSWQSVVEKTVTGLDLELVECERSAGGLLRVYIDKLPPPPGQEPGFITVDDCERVTRQLQFVLEVEGCDYARLEVSSPGLDRPLRTPAHYARFVGTEVEITLRAPFQGRKKYRGLLQQGEAEGWRLLFGEPGEEQVLDFQLDEVRDARLVPVINFKGRGQAPAPSKKPAKKPGAGKKTAASQDQKKPDGDQTP